MIYVIATVKLVDGKRGHYLEELNKIIPIHLSVIPSLLTKNGQEGRRG